MYIDGADEVDDNLNLIVLSKFVLEKVKDFEKEVGRFIEKVLCNY